MIEKHEFIPRWDRHEEAYYCVVCGVVKEEHDRYVKSRPNPSRRGLLRNAVKCLKCGEVIESKHCHDFVSCSCGNISVDGGLEYCRRVGTLKDYEELSEYTKDTETKA